MKVAICDDLQEDREQLKKYLYQLEKEKNIEFDIHEYDNPTTLFLECAEREDLKVIFFDVYMGDELGTDAAKKMREAGYRGSIIFSTTSQDHALDGFRVQADGYLVKPYSYEDFKRALFRLEEMFKEETKKVSFVSERLEYDLPLSSIYLIETYNKGCIVHTEKEDLFTWTKLKEFVDQIKEESFYQIGRFFLVNLNSISSIKDDRIVLKNNLKIDLPKREANRIKQDINNFIWKSMRK